MQNRRLESTREKKFFFLCFFILLFSVFFYMDGSLGVVKAETSGEEEAEETWKETGEGKTAEEQEARAERKEPRLYAKAALLMDASNNRVLYEKNGYEVMPMASTTKIMTAIIALEYGNLEDEVTVSSRAASMPKVHLGMKEGETYKLKDLLFSLMLESHNDSAVAIAEHIGGSVEGFAELMNQKARDLGCSDTFFITPNGLDAVKGDKAHSTTAYDLAKIASYAIQNDLFVALVGTKSHQFCELQSGRSFRVYNKDQFLDMMDGAIGIKTGFTNQAGYCFVGAVKKEDRVLVSVVLASGWPPNKSYKWADTKALMKIGVEDYQRVVVEQKEIPGTIAVTNGTGESVPLSMEWKDTELLLADWDEVEVTVEVKNELPAPVAEGEIVGYEKVLVNGEAYTVVPIETAGSMEEYTYQYCLIQLLHIFLRGA
ncbi:MAG: D-alanyl-D-alanine carboxypeptidase [Lachnospiraceae bacterium]|nr:D-alanyl-D-alanine carboxypeptidase [Lachnospiraceae bacterium]